MGVSAEKMAKLNHIARAEQDQLALASHQNAAAGTADGRLTAEIAPVYIGPKYEQMLATDNGVRTDTTIEQLAALKPVFDRRYGTVTAGNASPLTDGGAAVLLMREDKAKSLGYEPLAYIRSYAYAALDPGEQLLQAPVLAAPLALQRAGLTLKDIDLVEMHEAFAAQVLSNLRGIRVAVLGGTRRRVASHWPGGSREAQRHGRLDRDRPSIRRDRCANHDDASERAAAPRRTVRTDDRVRGRRYGLRDGRGAHMSTTALNVEVADGIAVVTFDLPGESVNKFNKAVIAELTALLDRFDSDEAIRAAVLLSGKPDVWIAGADIEEFLAFKTAEDAAQMSRAAQALVERVERGRVPVVAAIHGACMGGGLELALACPWRIASDHPKTILALPETQLGLIPGIGGTQRLPRTVGLQAALDMILTAKNIRGKKALQMGLVDELVHPAILRDIAIARAKEFAAMKRPRITRRAASIARSPARRQRAWARRRVPQSARNDAAENARQISGRDGGDRRDRGRLSKFAGARLRGRSTAVRRDGDDAGVQGTRVSVLRDDVAQEGRGVRGRADVGR